MTPCGPSYLSRVSASSTGISIQGRTFFYTSLLKSAIMMET